MSGVGSSELIILILIGLIVLGPKRLPQIANQIGRWIGQARRMTRAMRRQLEDELNFDDDKDIKPPFLADNSAKPEAHVPFEDDTYSPMHEDDDGEKAAVAGDEEPPVEDAAEEVKGA